MKKIIRSKFLAGLFAVALFLSFSVNAGAEYQYEVGGGYITSEEDNGPKVDVVGVGAVLHFFPVSTSGHPLAESAFLERIGSVSIDAGFGDLEGPSGSNLDADITRYIVMLEYMRPGLPYVMTAMLDKQDVELNAPGVGEMTTDGLGLGFGYFLQDGLRIGLSYGQEEEDINITVPPLGTQTTDYDNYTVEAKWVSSLSAGRALNAEGSIGKRDFDDGTTDGSNTIIDLSADYYVTNMFSLGAGISFNSGDEQSEEGDTFTLNLTNFFNENYYIDVNYEKFSADDKNFSDDEDGWDIYFTARF